jgi:hypothetical protein
MIEEAIVDAYSESEQAVGLHATLDQRLRCPFSTVVLGTTVTVKKIDVTAAGMIVAICYQGTRTPSDSDSRVAVAGSAADRMGVDRGLPPMGARPLVAGAARR